LGLVSVIDSEGRTICIADGNHDDRSVSLYTPMKGR